MAISPDDLFNARKNPLTGEEDEEDDETENGTSPTEEQQSNLNPPPAVDPLQDKQDRINRMQDKLFGNIDHDFQQNNLSNNLGDATNPLDSVGDAATAAQGNADRQSAIDRLQSGVQQGTDAQFRDQATKGGLGASFPDGSPRLGFTQAEADADHAAKSTSDQAKATANDAQDQRLRDSWKGTGLSAFRSDGTPRTGFSQEQAENHDQQNGLGDYAGTGPGATPPPAATAPVATTPPTTPTPAATPGRTAPVVTQTPYGQISVTHSTDPVQAALAAISPPPAPPGSDFLQVPPVAPVTAPPPPAPVAQAGQPAEDPHARAQRFFDSVGKPLDIFNNSKSGDISQTDIDNRAQRMRAQEHAQYENARLQDRHVSRSAFGLGGKDFSHYQDAARTQIDKERSKAEAARGAATSKNQAADESQQTADKEAQLKALADEAERKRKYASLIHGPGIH